MFHKKDPGELFKITISLGHGIERTMKYLINTVGRNDFIISSPGNNLRQGFFETRVYFKKMQCITFPGLSEKYIRCNLFSSIIYLLLGLFIKNSPAGIYITADSKPWGKLSYPFTVTSMTVHCAFIWTTCVWSGDLGPLSEKCHPRHWGFALRSAVIKH